MTGGEYRVVNPATGEKHEPYATISDDGLEQAIDRADGAHVLWGSGTSIEQRAKLMARVAELYTARRQELARIVTREIGKPIAQALGEVDVCASIYEYYAETVASLMADEPVELRAGDGTALIRRSSLGVLLGIMPWNYPYYQVARFAGPNLAIGNTILLKHAPQCPDSAAAMQEVFHEAGVPQDAYINIYATHEQIERVVGDARVRGVSFTGSARGGAAVAAVAGHHLKKVVLELGGSNPFIVLNVTDLEPIVRQAVTARLANTGQSCNAAKRFIVLAQHYDEFLEKFTAALADVEPGDPTLSHTVVGPLSSAAATDRLEQQVNRAIEGGAHLIAGGERDGNFFKPAVLTDVGPANPIYNDELFGPVAQVFKVSSEAEAVRLANDTPYGLGSFIFSSDEEQALRVADQIEAGMAFVNMVSPIGVELPFGGVKASGFGRELGRAGADEFVNKKTVRIA